jgi:hypothetical protein
MSDKILLTVSKSVSKASSCLLVAWKELLVRQYYLFLRKRIFYVQFTDQKTKRRFLAVSTGKINRDDTLFVVAGWLKDGIPQR